jgi:hypothetical protein
MRVSVPAPELDRPPIASALLVAALGLTAGLGVARWTVRPAPPSAEAPPEAMTVPTAEAGVVAGPSEPIAEEPEPTAATDPVPAPDAGTDAGEVAGAAPRPAPVTTAAPHGTLVRGRVAYLRCEAGASGAACARDAALEAATWAAIDALPTCPSAPASPGQADVVVELGDEVEVRIRDTFADDVVRLDPAATLGCLGSLSSDPALTASRRRVVLSFRFRLE